MTVLCSAFVRARISESRRNQVSSGGVSEEDESATSAAAGAAVAAGIPPEPVAERVVEAIRDDDLYVFTHIEYEGVIEARFQCIRDAFAKSKTSPSLSALPERKLILPA